MYQTGYGIIETLAPLHVGATVGEESSNVNLIFRDQFTQTGIVPGSSIRGRLRADMLSRLRRELNNEQQAESKVNDWYGRGAEQDRQQNYHYESIIKIEYASVVWLPVFSPGQPIVWISCPYLLKRYQRIAKINGKIPECYIGSSTLKTRQSKQADPVLFLNIGFLKLSDQKEKQDLRNWFPDQQERPAVVVADSEMRIIHDMALYRQSRIALKEEQKVTEDKAFFNVEALPEETILAFPFGFKSNQQQSWNDWQPLEEGNNGKCGHIYLGGLESVGFGHCYLSFYQH